MNGIRNLKHIALDSNIFIYHLEQNPKFINSVDEIFAVLTKGKSKAVTSIITLIEILSYPGSGSVAAQLTNDFYATPNLTVWEVNREISEEAAKIRREYRLRLPDAVQLATAVKSKSQVFITNDQNLKKFKGLKVLLTGEVSI